jgi:hypothetical protein
MHEPLFEVFANSSLSLRAQFKSCIQKLIRLYSDVSDELASVRHGQVQLKNFIREFTHILTGQPVNFETIAADPQLRQAILTQLRSGSDPSSEQKLRRKIRRLTQRLEDVSAGLRVTEIAIEDKDAEIFSLQAQNSRIRTELSNGRSASGNSHSSFHPPHEDARSISGSADDYEELVRQLRQKCSRQQKIIQSLSE